MEPEDKIGAMLQDTLYHLKSIEHRLAWGSAVSKLKGNDKHIFNKAVAKVKSALIDISMIIDNPSLRNLILKDVNNNSRVVHYMAAVESLYSLPEEELYEVTDLIEDYLNRKADERDLLLSTDRQDQILDP